LRDRDSLDIDGDRCTGESGDRFFMLVGLTTFKTKQSSHWLYIRLKRLYFLAARTQIYTLPNHKFLNNIPEDWSKKD
jgi:hypothetical protein